MDKSAQSEGRPSVESPEVGDTVHIRASAPSGHADAYGIVSQVGARRQGDWESVEVLIAGQRLWFKREDVDYVLKERNPFRRGPGKAQAPCRLFVVLAREAASGVIFRRGPTDWVQLVKWDTATDTFAPGQWFHGRLYEQRADLSPDGTLLIYFAAKAPGRPSQEGDGFYAWTAVSKPPYLTALALWPKRCSGTYFGGGLFADGAHVWLNHLPGEAEAHPEHRPPDWLAVAPRVFDPRYLVGYYRRLQRDGWRVDRDWWERWAPAGFVGAPRAWHEKPHLVHPHRLALESDVFHSSEAPTYALLNDRSGDLAPLPEATWADWDQRGRLVYAREGKLFAATIGEGGPSAPSELADFNALRPEPRQAPAWAREW